MSFKIAESSDSSSKLSRRYLLASSLIAAGGGAVVSAFQGTQVAAAVESNGHEQSRVARHPLDPLTNAELAETAEILRAADKLAGDMRIVFASLDEPNKQAVVDRQPGQPIARQALIVLLDRATGAGYEAVVDVQRRAVMRFSALDVALHPPYILEEFIECEAMLKASPEFQAALAQRGITEMSLLMLESWPAGRYDGDPLEEQDRRLIRTTCFVRAEPEDNGYARPVDNLVAVVDLGTMTLVRIEDYGAAPLPPEPGNFFRQYVPAGRAELRPLEIVQPDGPSFVVEGNEVRWDNWRFRIGYNHREGLVLHTVGYADQGRDRPLLHRASICELCVMYGDPREAYYRKNPFDIGEMGIGWLANSLEPKCDCIGATRYFDVPLLDNWGQVFVLKNAVCLHEEDAGILWKHTDFRLNKTEVRRGRRLVVSFVATVGNYEYGFSWSFCQDGSLHCDVKLTGIMNTTCLHEEEQSPWGVEVAPRLNAPFHQHIFVARLDMDVDGEKNSVYEVNTAGIPGGEDNPYDNAFRAEATLLATEHEAQRSVHSATSRFWKVVNPSRLNRLGMPVGYRLVPGENSPALPQPASAIRRRAGFAAHQLWVTPFDPAERYPAGEFVNRHPGGDGLPRWTAANRSLVDTDVVLWYVFGHAHVPRPEDWPVMPTASLGFSLKPDGFFERNPALDVPPTA